jgi:DNA primase
MAINLARPADRAGRIDTAALKLAHPIEEVVGRYGIELRRQGRALVGRCPFHADGGRPNLHIFPTQSWFCFRCGVGGDVVKFVMLAEDLGFLDAVAHLHGATLGPLRLSPKQLSRPTPRASGGRDPEELAVLHAAVSLYHNTLLATPRALQYLAGRGLDAATIEQCRLGYAPGDQLNAFLRWHRLPVGPALHLGLLTQGGAEFLAGRIVVPALSSGRPVWLIGRRLDDNLPDDAPVHLGLPGAKPLLGLGDVRSAPTVIVVEGSFDYLTLRMWGYPVVAALGTHLRPDLVERLRGFQRQYLVLDNDDAGLEATLTLLQELGSTAVPVALPDGIKDPSQLATRQDGRKQFAATLLEAVGRLPTEFNSGPNN